LLGDDAFLRVMEGSDSTNLILALLCLWSRDRDEASRALVDEFVTSFGNASEVFREESVTMASPKEIELPPTIVWEMLMKERNSQ
jgi:hypothetical protein